MTAHRQPRPDEKIVGAVKCDRCGESLPLIETTDRYGEPQHVTIVTGCPGLRGLLRNVRTR